jgi:hypothetical protein
MAVQLRQIQRPRLDPLQPLRQPLPGYTMTRGHLLEPLAPLHLGDSLEDVARAVHLARQYVRRKHPLAPAAPQASRQRQAHPLVTHPRPLDASLDPRAGERDIARATTAAAAAAVQKAGNRQHALGDRRQISVTVHLQYVHHHVRPDGPVSFAGPSLS